MPGLVQRLDHRLELLHLPAAPAEGGVVVVRGEEADGVVAPVVPQPALDQGGVVDELVHRHQLDRGHPDPPEMLDHRRVGQAGVRAAHVLRDARVPRRHPLDVTLVDHRLVERDPQRPVVGPVEERIDHHGLLANGAESGVLAESGRRTGRRTAPRSTRSPGDRLGVRVEQQLAGLHRSPGTGHRGRAPDSRTAGRARPGAGSRARPDLPLRQVHPGLLADFPGRVSKRQSSIRSAISEKSAKLVPPPS